jgi:hypothetical protein
MLYWLRSSENIFILLLREKEFSYLDLELCHKPYGRRRLNGAYVGKIP